MGDNDVFGVRHPVTGETGYCSIIGNLKVAYGLVVYPGAEGWFSYRAMQDEPAKESMIDKRSLLLLFGNRHELTEVERTAIENLKLDFREEWPLFRSFLPSCFPWSFCAEEAGFFLPVMEQARLFSIVCRKNPAVLASLREHRDQVLVRVRTDDVWRSEWSVPPRVLEHPFPIIEPSRNLVRHIGKNCRRRDSVWEFGTSYWPEPIRDSDRERPYYPLLVLWADRFSYYVVYHQLIKADQQEALAGSFLVTVQKEGEYPAAIRTDRLEYLSMLEPLAVALGIDLKYEEHLIAIESARSALHEHINLEKTRDRH
jgi:hypothetical protein